MESSEMETSRIITWQKKLLPFMVGMLTALTIFFFIASLVQLYYLHRRIEQIPELDLDPALNILKDSETKTTESGKLDYARWKTLSILEKHALQRRYHQANVLLMSRIWTRYLGFVTGMILALVGAAFILGKLREPEARLNVDSVWKFSITSASPGLILAVLGTILMITTIVTHFEIEVKDKPLYTSRWGSPSLTETPQPQPQPFTPQSDEEILGDMKKKLGIKEPKKSGGD